MKPTILKFCAVAMATLVVSGAHAQCDVPAECELIAQDNSSVSIDTSPGVCVLVKTLDFTLDSTSNVFVVFDLGHSHGCCHHTSLVFQLDLDGETIFDAELPFIAGSPGGCGNTTGDCTFLGDVAAGDHTIEIFLCDEGQNCILEVYACPAVGAPAGLDIKPGSCPNPFNCNSNGTIPVALLGTDTFDVKQVDLSSIQLSRKVPGFGFCTPHEGPPGPHSTFDDVGTPFEGDPQDPADCCHDLGGDDTQDLLMHFKTADCCAALGLDQLAPGTVFTLVLTGTLLDGSSFSVEDCMVKVPVGAAGNPQVSVESNAPGAWIDVTPMDVNVDGGGFAPFARSFPTVVLATLTAPKTYEGRPFVGWTVAGRLAGTNAGPQGDPTLHLLIWSETTVTAVYGVDPSAWAAGSAKRR